ncbi:MAG: septum formation initiator family protein [Pseudomonadota bacterium]
MATPILLGVAYGLFFYLIYSTFYSSNGLITYSHTKRTHSELLASHAQWLQTRAYWQKTVDRVKPETLRSDVLEELARTKLGFVGPDDRVIFLQPSVSIQSPRQDPTQEQ